LKQNRYNNRIITVQGRINNINLKNMTNKIKFAVPFLALGLLLSSVAVFAQDTTSGTGTANTTTTIVTKKVCVANAKTARVAAIKTASDTAKVAKTDAKTTLTAALVAAKANTDKVAATAAKKAANAAYKASLKEIAKTQAASVKTAWSDYATAVKACPKK